MKKLNVRQITCLAILLALAIVLSVIESYIPSPFPGAKLGLANLVIILSMNAFGFWMSLLLNITRVVLASCLTGSIFGMGFYMSMAGAILSFLVMYLAKRFFTCFTVVGVSLLGAFTHSLAQIFVAMAFYETVNIIYYFPLLSLLSLACGCLNGFIAELLLNNGFLKRVLLREKEHL